VQAVNVVKLPGTRRENIWGKRNNEQTDQKYPDLHRVININLVRVINLKLT
jgi:hypothetical protein